MYVQGHERRLRVRKRDREFLGASSATDITSLAGNSKLLFSKSPRYIYTLDVTIQMFYRKYVILHYYYDIDSYISDAEKKQLKSKERRIKYIFID